MRSKDRRKIEREKKCQKRQELDKMCVREMEKERTKKESGRER